MIGWIIIEGLLFYVISMIWLAVYFELRLCDLEEALEKEREKNLRCLKELRRVKSEH